MLFCVESPGRRETLLDLLARHQLKPKAVESWRAFVEGRQTLAITVAPIDRGLLLPNDRIALITESQLFGQRVLQTRRRKRQTEIAENVVRNLSELRIGAPVVHIDHGVGRYCGLQTLTIDNQEAEFVTLEYADGAKLYVPVASLHLISRYSGAEGDATPLHKFGNEQWQKAKRKAAEQIRDVAAELLDIYCAPCRAPRPGLCRSAATLTTHLRRVSPSRKHRIRLSAIAAVLEDMKAPRAMDRLVCGDVGFGKTEVAMRAAFVAVHSGMQVAILVPTTLLAQQHYESFKDRFADWPVAIEVLSRFRSDAEQTEVLARLAEGKVDILIGTHKLLQPDVRYQKSRSCHHRRRTPFRRAPERAAESVARARRYSHADRDTDSAHAQYGDGGHARSVDYRHAARAPFVGKNLCASIRQRSRQRSDSARNSARRSGVFSAQRCEDDRKSRARFAAK